MPKYTVNTSRGQFEVDADRQPTQQEGEDWANGNVSAGDNSEQSASHVAQGVALEVGGAIAGAALGTALTAFTAGGAAPLVPILSVAGGGIGNYAKQLLELHRGERKNVKAGELAASALLSWTPIGKVGSSVTMAVLKRGGQGAIQSVGAEQVKKWYDEGSMLTPEEAAMAFGFGGAFGGALGGLERRYATVGKLITNNAAAKTAQAAAGLGVGAYVYNDQVESGGKDPLATAFMYAAGTVAGTHIPSYIAKMDKAKVARALGPEMVVGKKVVAPIDSFKNQLAANEYEAFQYGNSASKLADRQSNPIQTNADLNSVLDGKANISILPPEMHQYIYAWQNVKKANSKLLSTMVEDPVLAKSIENNDYVRTAYAAHAPEGKFYQGQDFATPDSILRLREEIMTTSVGKTAAGKLIYPNIDEAAVQMNAMLHDPQYLYRGDIAIKGNSVASPLMHKRDLTPATRAFLGEITDPGARMFHTLSAQSRLILSVERDKEVAEQMLKAGLARKVSSSPNEFKSFFGAGGSHLQQDFALGLGREAHDPVSLRNYIKDFIAASSDDGVIRHRPTGPDGSVVNWGFEPSNPSEDIPKMFRSTNSKEARQFAEEVFNKARAMTGLTPEEIGKLGFVALSSGGSDKIAKPFAGLYAHPEVVKAFQELSSPNLLGEGNVSKLWMTLASASKMSKTVLNPLEAIMPQVMGNVVLSATSGRVSLHNLYEGYIAMMKSNGWLGGKLTGADHIAVIKDIAEQIKFGVLKGGADVQELKAFMSAASDMSSIAKDDGWAKNSLNLLTKFYSTADVAVRSATYKNNLEVAHTIFKGSGKGLDELKQWAATVTNDTIPTYDKVVRRYKQLSAVGAANVFGAFEYEVVRNTKNQIALGVSLLNEGRKLKKVGEHWNPMMTEGMRRLAGVFMVGSATAAIGVTASRQFFGTSDQDSQDLDRVIPSFDKGKSTIKEMLPDGKFAYTALSYVLPHANIMGAINTALNGEDPTPYVKNVYFGNDFGPMVTAGLEMVNNTYYGTKVPITQPIDRVALMERFVTRAFVPQIISGTMNRALHAAKGDVNALGGSPTGGDVAARIAGYRRNTYDILASAVTRIRDISDPIQDQSAGYRNILKKSIKMGDESLNEGQLYDLRNDEYVKGQQELANTYDALMRLSKDETQYTQKEVIAAFRQAGVPNRMIAGAVLGYTVPMKRGISESNSEFIDKIMATPEGRSNATSLIRAEAGGDPFRTRALIMAYKEQRVGEARGKDAVTALFSTIPVQDGERSENIIRAMRANPETAKELRKKLVRSGVINGQVAHELAAAGH